MVLRTKMSKNPCKFSIYLTLFFTFEKCKNNNSSMGAIVSFIVGMFTAFGGNGYVWINTISVRVNRRKRLGPRICTV